MHQRADQAILMGCVLLGIAIIVPGVYFFMFFRSITQQIQKMHIQKPTAVYTVRLCAPPQGITITWPQKKTPPLSCRWESVCRVYRNKNCIYLFTAENQAFLLPEGQADTDTDTLWEFLVKHAGVEKAIVL
ncbi:MAG: YcxB family protein [Lachnospiraceae bacterium]|nr:YcxB family protein [Lachnospiraceae bacterium]